LACARSQQLEEAVTAAELFKVSVAGGGAGDSRRVSPSAALRKISSHTCRNLARPDDIGLAAQLGRFERRFKAYAGQAA
jgi:hypothetical protein